MDCKSLLVVEDDEDIRIFVAEALEMEGYLVHTAENGKLALDYLSGLDSADLPGCIILDLMMPEMDEATFMAVLERDYKQEFGSIQILVATAEGVTFTKPNNSQAVARIQKPFNLEELYTKVEEHCGKPKKP